MDGSSVRFAFHSRQAVENLWTERAFPVNRRTAKFFLKSFRRDLRIDHLRAALSYGASLDRVSAKRRMPPQSFNHRTSQRLP